MTDVSRGAAAATQQLQSDLIANISLLLDVLVRVGRGEAIERLDLRYPETHPVGALTCSLNEMIASLAEARGRSDNYSRDLQDKLGAIQAQDAAIAELSVPILEVWDGVLCMPIVGIVDSARTAEMARTLLNTIVQTKAQLALLDITGIQVMDTRVVDHFLRMARAVRLLGARCVLSGVHPNVSQTIVHMGLDLRGIETHRSMRDALRHFVAKKRGTTRGAPEPWKAIAKDSPGDAAVVETNIAVSE
ncbi:MAG TPA: STAS domain-containing protein [Polyangiaceae bacterium]|jgi:rsbT co-antagonist protein RsbR|nr:STAS domain-containing protein [Polyangiaceae bacterium]